MDDALQTLLIMYLVNRRFGIYFLALTLGLVQPSLLLLLLLLLSLSF